MVRHYQRDRKDLIERNFIPEYTIRWVNVKSTFNGAYVTTRLYTNI